MIRHAKRGAIPRDQLQVVASDFDGMTKSMPDSRNRFRVAMSRLARLAAIAAAVLLFPEREAGATTIKVPNGRSESTEVALVASNARTAGAKDARLVAASPVNSLAAVAGQPRFAASVQGLLLGRFLVHMDPPIEFVVTTPPSGTYFRADSMEGIAGHIVDSSEPNNPAGADLTETTTIKPCGDPDTRDKRFYAYAMGSGPGSAAPGGGPGGAGSSGTGVGPMGPMGNIDFNETIVLARGKNLEGTPISGVGQFTALVVDDQGGDPAGGPGGTVGMGPAGDDCCGGDEGAGGCGGCGTGGSGGRTAGTAHFALQSVLARFSLGMATDRRDAGVFAIRCSELPPASPHWASRYWLDYDRLSHALQPGVNPSGDLYLNVIAKLDDRAPNRLRQLMVWSEQMPRSLYTLIDLVDVDPNDPDAGYDISYYSAELFALGSHPHNAGGDAPFVLDEPNEPATPFRKYEVRPNGASSIIISDFIRLEDDDTSLSPRGSVVYSYDAGEWQLDFLTPGDVLLRRQVLTNWDESGSTRTRTLSIYDASSDPNEPSTLVYREQQTETEFEYFPGVDPVWRRTQVIVDPGDGGLNLTTNWTYSTDRVAESYHGLVLESVEYPDGSWAWYTIRPNDPNDPYDSSWLVQTISGLGDHGMPGSAPSPKTSNTYTVTKIYGRDHNQKYRLASREEYQGTILVKKYEYELGVGDPPNDIRTDYVYSGDPNDPLDPIETAIRWRTQGESSNDHIIAQRRYAEIVLHPSGSGSLFDNLAAYDDHSHYEETNKPMALSDYPDPHIPDDDSDDPNNEYMLWEETHCAVDGGDPELIVGESTYRARWLDCRGLVYFDELYVYAGEDTWERLSWTARLYDRNSRITKEWNSRGERWTYSYSSCCSMSVTDIEGRVTISQRDFVGRPTSIAHDFPGQDVRTTAFTYGAATKSVTTADTLSETVVQTYDKAMRPTSVLTGSEDGRLKTLINYSVTSGGGWKVTTFRDYAYDASAGEDGVRDSVTQYLRDGRTKSVTGGSVVGQFYSYGQNPSGQRWTEVHSGASDSSDRWTKTYVDMLGRTAKVESPAWDTGSTLTTSYTYDGTTGLLDSMSQPGIADTEYAYDESGHLFKTTLMASAGGSGLEDRISETEHGHEYISGQWWSVSRSFVYPPSSGTRKLLTEQRSRITGFEGSGSTEFENAESVSIDISGNETTTTSYVIPGASGSPPITRRVETVSPESTTTAVQKFNAGRLVESTSSTNVVTTYHYDALGRTIKVTDARGNDHETGYDASGRVIWTKDEPGNQTDYVYYIADSDPSDDVSDGVWPGRLQFVENPENKKSYYSYKPRGETWRTWGDVPYPTEEEYDAYGQRTVLRTYRTHFDYNSLWTASTWPGSPGTADDTTWAYDGYTGLLDSKTYDDSTSVVYTYTTDNRLSTRKWARNSTDGKVTTYANSNKTGEVTGVSYSSGMNMTNVSYTFDRLGRMTQVVDAAGTRAFAYDTVTLQPLTETFTAGVFSGSGTNDLVIKQLYDDPNEPLPGRWRGIRLGVAADDDLYYQATYAFDALGRMNRVNGPGLPGSTNGGAWYTWTAGSGSSNTGLLASVTIKDPNDVVKVHSDWTYESTRDLVAGVGNYWGSGTGTALSNYAYVNDTRGRRESVTRTGAAFTNEHTDVWAYNDRNELIQTRRYNDITYPFSSSPNHTPGRDWEYDAIGNRVEATIGSGTAAPVRDYQTNALNQYFSVTLGNPNYAMALHYDLDGNLTQRFAAGDVDGDNEVDEDDQDLVDAAEIAGSTCADPTPLSSGEFARADANADCVIDAYDQGVVNDALGFEPDHARYEYAWDAENRLISVTPAALPVNPVLGATYFKVSYKYDYLGRRFERTVSDYNYMTDAWDLVHERRRFVWGSAPAGNGWLMLREIIDTDSTSPPDGSFDTPSRIRTYTWGRDLGGHGGGSSGSASCGTGLAPVGCLTAAGGIGGLLAVHDDVGSSADVDYVYTYDANGNVGQVVDYAAGSASASMVAKYVYEAYGSTVAKAGSYADVNTFRFSTKYWDDPAGLGYWGYRYYDAGLGRWISRDPISETGGNNLLQYAKNSPSENIDRFGEQTVDAGESNATDCEAQLAQCSAKVDRDFVTCLTAGAVGCGIGCGLAHFDDFTRFTACIRDCARSVTASCLRQGMDARQKCVDDAVECMNRSPHVAGFDPNRFTLFPDWDVRRGPGGPNFYTCTCTGQRFLGPRPVGPPQTATSVFVSGIYCPLSGQVACDIACKLAGGFVLGLNPVKFDQVYHDLMLARCICGAP